MRFLVTMAVLTCGSAGIAQTRPVDTPVQKPASLTEAPVRRAVPPGAGLGPVKPVNVPGVGPGAAKLPLPASTPVVTLEGVCGAAKTKSGCKTIITREDLDRFISAYTPANVGETGRSRLAVQYARTLTFSLLAEQQGLDKNPVLTKELALELKLARARILARYFVQNLQQRAAVVTQPEIQKYYEEHRADYEQAQVRRLAVPVLAPTEDGHPPDHSAVKAEMEKVRLRIAAGEDPNQVQQDAYKHLHILATPPPVTLLTLRRSSIQGEEAKALSLNPGEVTGVLDLPGAFAVYKLESKESAPLSLVREEILTELRRDRVANEINRLTSGVSAQFNLEYLGLSSQPQVFGTMAASPAPVPGARRPLPVARGPRRR